MLRRPLLAALALAALTAAPAIAQEPLRLVVCAPGGSTVDLTARLWADALKERLSQPVVVEPRAGGGGMVGVEAVARARADGMTALVCFPGSFTMRPHLGVPMAVDPNTALTPVSLLATAPFVFAADARHGATLPAFLAAAKAPGADFSYASVGNGSLAHLGMELFKARAGVGMVHVPYRGSPEAIADMLGGRIAAFITPLSAVQGHVEQGRLAALFTTGERRLPQLPNVPTAREAGLPDLTVITWHGLFLPAGVPEAAVARLSAAVMAAAREDARLREGLGRAGSDLPVTTPAQAKAHITAESETWKRVIAEAGIKAD
ncbi:MAG: tripartite tricarboxylate transporter substrate binding protein [Acetobacteraceae bacterium]|jgi:tripartite-type tricarboxylate transporter receptor subunit TctC|nr:tripartite tricarboxylate transporter substrate binding protein [Acetobacteraceae bacterium]